MGEEEPRYCVKGGVQVGQEKLEKKEKKSERKG